MTSNSQTNYLTLTNNMHDTNYTANQFQMSAGTSTNGLYIYNIKRASTATTITGTSYGNGVTMSATDSYHYLNLVNYRPTVDSDLYANRIVMTGTPTNGGLTNSVGIYNYDVDGGNLSNSFVMSKSSSTNVVKIDVNRGGQNVALFTMTKGSDNTVQVDLGTTSNNTYGYRGAQIHFRSDGVINISGVKVQFNGTDKWS